MPTCELSSFMDILLKPFLRDIPSYTKDFLNKCQREPKRKTVIATFVVVRLCISILQELGLHAINYVLTNSPVTGVLDF